MEKFYRLWRFQKVDIFGRNFEISKNLENSKIWSRDALLLYEFPSGHQVDGSPLVAIEPAVSRQPGSRRELVEQKQHWHFHRFSFVGVCSIYNSQSNRAWRVTRRVEVFSPPRRVTRRAMVYDSWSGSIPPSRRVMTRRAEVSLLEK